MLNEKNLLKYLYVTIFLMGSVNLGFLLSRINTPFSSPLGRSYSVLSASVRGGNEHLVYGFLPYWALDNIEYIQLDKVTDIAYFALSINPNGSIKKISDEGYTEPGYNHWKNNEELEKFINKAKQQNVRFALTLISHENDITYEFLNCRSCWDTALGDLVKELQRHNIANVNVDFELTDRAEGDIAQRYTEFVSFLNTSLDLKLKGSFVVVSTLPDSTYRPRITDLEGLNTAADAIFIMGYDFHRPTSENAGPVAPIKGAGEVSEYDVTKMLLDYLKYVPKEKLILGVPYYGYNWLVNSWAPNATRIPGTDLLGHSISQTYEGVIETKLKYKPEVMWDSYAMSPFFTYYNYEKGTVRQVYFENAKSLSQKYNMIKDYDLAGVGIWALGYDGGYQELWNVLGASFK